MNLREKFIWNGIIVLSLLLLGWNAWDLYTKHSKISSAYKKYNNEKVGTDKELQDMVVELENNLNTRLLEKDYYVGIKLNFYDTNDRNINPMKIDNCLITIKSFLDTNKDSSLFLDSSNGIFL